MCNCEILETCIFFNDRMEAMPATSGWLKAHYCRDRFEECARYQVYKALGRPLVPSDLFPTQTSRAQALLTGAAPPAEPGQPAPGDPAPVKPTPKC